MNLRMLGEEGSRKEGGQRLANQMEECPAGSTDAQTRAGDRQLMLVSDNTRTRPSGVSEGSEVAR